MSTSAGGPEPPVARVEPLVREHHGVRRVDDFAWMREVSRAETIGNLQAERAYYDHETAHLRSLRDELFVEMTRRTLPADSSVSWTRGGYVYLTRTVEDRDYEQFVRHNPVTGVDDVLLDENLVAEGHEYCEIALREVSPDGRLLAWSVDHDGDEVFQLRFRDLSTGADLADSVRRTYYGGAWSADSLTFFYVVHDDAYRPWQVWRHTIGSPQGADLLVLQEDDEQFELDVEQARSGRFVVITMMSRDTSEVWLVPTAAPASQPRLVEARRRGVEYSVEHAPGHGPDGSDALLILTNDGAQEFRLVSAPTATPGREHWVEVLPEKQDERLSGVDAFAGHVVLSVTSGDSTLLRILPLGRWTDPTTIEAGTAASIALGRNEEYTVDQVTVMVESWSWPPTWESVTMATGERAVLKQLAAPGYDVARYVSERIGVPVDDGVIVPVTLVRHRDVPLDGTAPCLLYGYGAYEASEWPQWDVALPSLLDRGVVFACAHVRGGGEGGRRWWLDGRLEHKQNTFSDFVAVADALADGRVDGARIVSRGLSAGGLLQGAAFSQRPDRWRAVVAEVPFVDVVTTMLDPSIPLTAEEWDEWGDPRRPDDFAWMLAYSPYDNLPPADGRPDLLVTAAVHDPRVMVWEPAKWVAALRRSAPTWSRRCLFRVELGSGAHTGPSGRYAHLHYEAEVYAWVLDRMGLVPSLGASPVRSPEAATTPS